MQSSRRRALKGLLALGLLPAARARSAAGARVVVLGGGFAGATAAKYLRLWGEGSVQVTLVEREPQFVSCPMSNLVLGGSRTLPELTLGYETLRVRYGVRVVHGEVAGIDLAGRTVAVGDARLPYDRLVVAPGIELVYEGIPGLADAAAREAVPHAWKAGAQTLALRKRLEQMRNGDVVVMGVPPMPFRCPPAPYERACQIAFLLRNSRPKSKLIVLDANPEIVAKGDQFLEAWQEKYPGLIDYRPGQAVTDVDAAAGSVRTDFETVKAQVINIIPPQRAGRLADLAGLTNVDGRWCGVSYLDYQSTVAPGVHVIGDAVAGSLPKSGHMANAQAKVCAASIIAQLNEVSLLGGPVLANTCYSFVSASEAMHVSYLYRYDPDTRTMKSVEGGGHSERASRLEAYYARAWAMNIWSDTLL